MLSVIYVWKKDLFHLHIKCSSAPHLHTVQSRKLVRHKRRDPLQIVGAHPGGQQRLVGVPHRCVHQEQTVCGLGVVANGLRKLLRPLLQIHVTPTCRGLIVFRLSAHFLCEKKWLRLRLRLRYTYLKIND